MTVLDDTTQATQDPALISGDPACVDTPADRAGGGLGALAYLLRVLLYRFLPPWVFPPPGYRPYDVQLTIATPAIGSTSTILSLLVPIGFASKISRLNINIIGPGFVQGSGSLIFAVTVDNAPVKGYGAILTEFGSPQIQRPTDGILANSQQTIRVTVNNVSYAAAGTNVTAGLSGYHYPQPRGRHPR